MGFERVRFVSGCSSAVRGGAGLCMAAIPAEGVGMRAGFGGGFPFVAALLARLASPSAADSVSFSGTLASVLGGAALDRPLPPITASLISMIWPHWRHFILTVRPMTFSSAI